MTELPLPVPPQEIQQETTARLSRLTDVIDKGVFRLEEQILLLQEHRQALITAAVTGQLDMARMAG